MTIRFAHNPEPAAPPTSIFRHSHRIITEPDGFDDAVSGVHLAVDFQRRQERASRVEQFQTPDWALDFGVANARTRVRGVLRGGWASLCLVRGPGDSTWNSQPAKQGTIACLPPGEELDGRTDAGFSWLTIAVPPSVWAQCQALAGADRDCIRTLTAYPLPAPLFAQIEARVQTAHRLLHRGTAEAQRSPIASHEAASLAVHCFTTVYELASRTKPPRDSLRNRTRLARRADAWMRAHIAESVHVPDVCLALRVSRRELEYAFRNVFDQSPHDHLLALRLNAIRRVLRRSGEPIARVAFDHGIEHLGRFAAQYRALFGEQPSATRPARVRAPSRTE